MNRYILLLLLSLSLYHTHAQDWCRPGATWHYTYGAMYASGFDVYSIMADTTVAARQCYQLSGKSYVVNYNFGGFYTYDTAAIAPIYTYESGDTAYFYYSLLNEWRPAHFFAAHVGDTLSMTNAPFPNTIDTNVLVIVDNTDTTLINGYPLRRYTYHFVDSCFIQPFQGTVIERLGIMDNSIIPSWRCVTDGDTYTLCSYQDDSFAVYPQGVNCISLPTGIAEAPLPAWKIYPNPANDAVIFYSDESATGTIVAVSDGIGRKVSTTVVTKPNTSIPTATLANGIYMVRATYPDQRSGVMTLLIQH